MDARRGDERVLGRIARDERAALVSLRALFRFPHSWLLCEFLGLRAGMPPLVLVLALLAPM